MNHSSPIMKWIEPFWLNYLFCFLRMLSCSPSPSFLERLCGYPTRNFASGNSTQTIRTILQVSSIPILYQWQPPSIFLGSPRLNSPNRLEIYPTLQRHPFPSSLQYLLFFFPSSKLEARKCFYPSNIWFKRRVISSSPSIQSCYNWISLLISMFRVWFVFFVLLFFSISILWNRKLRNVGKGFF